MMNILLMSPELFSIIVLFFIILLLIMIKYSLIPAWIKILLIVLSVGFSIFSYEITINQRGWAVSSDDFSKKSQFIWAVAIEPSFAGDPNAGIWLWITEKINEKRVEPRAYRIPYTREMHKKIEKAKQDITHGIPVTLFNKKYEIEQGFFQKNRPDYLYFENIPIEPLPSKE